LMILVYQQRDWHWDRDQFCVTSYEDTVSSCPANYGLGDILTSLLA
jgi:hypothetical protein